MTETEAAGGSDGVDARAVAALLIEGLRDGRVSPRRFFEDYPLFDDRTLQHAFEDVWGFYSGVHGFAWSRSGFSPEQAALMTRWVMYLRGGFAASPARSLERDPPADNVIVALTVVLVIGGAVVAGAAQQQIVVRFWVFLLVSMGGFWIVMMWRRRMQRVWAPWMRRWDFMVYPFTSIEEYEAAGGQRGDLLMYERCLRCGYDLRGQQEPGCLECAAGRGTGGSTSGN